MNKIESFTVNHLNLPRGVFTSRVDYTGGQPITTYDIRMKSPNIEPVMNTAEIHTIEHLGATYLRNLPSWAREIIYFGPMGCRTGFYLIVGGTAPTTAIAKLLADMFEFIANFNDAIPGASAKECGNYLDMNLPMARYEAQKFLMEILNDPQPFNLSYPQ
ncbi:MAG: S-ribosylhomocysteine lyase [Epulopiscium sp. Nele67-Bin004]|nr:MAG: S-ribosylhomocysteine lyase [Epulopiscium sp. Nele67-Bin004]